MSGKRRAERIRALKKKTCLKGKRDVKKKMPRLQEKEISMKRHAKRNGCQERKGKRHAERKRDLKKSSCQGKEGRQEKDAKTSREKDFKERACREKRMSGKRRAERIRALKKKTCQGKERRQEKDAKTSSPRDPGLLPACDLIIPLSQYDCKKIS